MNDHRASISTHYSNDEDRLYRFARRADPPWYPELGFHPDAIVMIVCLVLAVAALFGVWYTEGGL